MSIGVVKDGTGSGVLAKVNSNNRLIVSAESISLRAIKARQGRVYIINTGQLPLTTTKGLMAWLSYTDPEKYLAIVQLSTGWNGGSTNHNRGCEITYNVQDTQPTTNTATLSINNTNMDSSLVLNASALKWDGVGTGMTGHTAVLEFSSSMVGPGQTIFDYGGAIIIGPNKRLSVYARGEEAGTFNFSAWFVELDAEDMEI